jgi:hypothetical protein
MLRRLNEGNDGTVSEGDTTVQLVATCSIVVIDRDYETAEIGYRVAPNIVCHSSRARNVTLGELW